jgi:hypothetical protein
VSTIDRIAIRRVAVERATVISGQSFDAVLAKLAAALGHPDMSAFARDVVAAGTSAAAGTTCTTSRGTRSRAPPAESIRAWRCPNEPVNSWFNTISAHRDTPDQTGESHRSSRTRAHLPCGRRPAQACRCRPMPLAPELLPHAKSLERIDLTARWDQQAFTRHAARRRGSADSQVGWAAIPRRTRLQSAGAER